MQAGLEVASAVTAGGALGARVPSGRPSGRLPAPPPEPIVPPSKRMLGVRTLPTDGRAAGAAEVSRVRSGSMSGARRKRHLPGAFGFLARGRPDNLPANHVQFVRNRGR